MSVRPFAPVSPEVEDVPDVVDVGVDDVVLDVDSSAERRCVA